LPVGWMPEKMRFIGPRVGDSWQRCYRAKVVRVKPAGGAADAP